ncbi:universal stress protein [Flavobacteriaceae bacterium]|nr:universal stress protein [Flavobacteriaceae bacterium]
MKRILVPIDFSDQARAAAMVAADIARKTDSEIHLIHMLELPVDMVDPTGITNVTGPTALFYMEQTQKEFEEFAKDPMFKDLKVVQNLQFAKTFSGIIQGAEKAGIDLVVMGSKGATGISEMLIGSNTEKVVRKSPIPVLVIKEEMPIFSPNKILFASDFDPESISSLQKLEVFNAVFNARIEVLRVNTINNFETSLESEDKIQEFIDKAGVPVSAKHIYNDESVERGVLNFAKAHNFDLIALTTHGRSGLSHLFNGSIGEDLANHAMRPVITFKV